MHADYHKQHTHEALDDDGDIFDDDAPLLSAIQVSRAPETAGGPLVHPVRYSSGPHKVMKPQQTLLFLSPVKLTGEHRLQTGAVAACKTSDLR